MARQHVRDVHLGSCLALIPVLDGHNDTLTRIRRGAPSAPRSFLDELDDGHLDLPRARRGGLVGGFFAIFTASPEWKKRMDPLLDDGGEIVREGWSVPLAPRVVTADAHDFTRSVVDDLLETVRDSDGDVVLVRAAADLERCVSGDAFGVILHVEGAEAFSGPMPSSALEVLHERGLRSLGPVWSRPNDFGHGVPFDFPRHPDTGPGLTTEGRGLVAQCNELRIMIDLSHLNERGFWDVAELSDAPLVATHSNAHALCASPRNLTDAQLDAIGRSGGVVGINFAVGFLRADGRPDPDTPLTRIGDHARHIADRIGVEHVALGSDFDGAMIPAGLGDVTGLPKLMEALGDAGFDEDDLHLIAYSNWIRVLRETWGG